MANWDTLFGAALAGLGGAMIVVAAGFPAITGLAVGPSLFPTLIGTGMVLTGAVIAIGAWRVAQQTTAPPVADQSTQDRFFTWNLALVSALILAFLAMVNFTGFSIACFAVIFVMLRVYHRERLLTDLILTAISVLVVFVTFSSVFRVSLPVGPLEILFFKIIG